MKIIKTTSMLIMGLFCLAMVPGAFAVDEVTILPIPNCQIPEIEYLNVNLNEEIAISLYSNPSTGYSWLTPRYNTEFLTLTGSEYIPYYTTPEYFGSGGDQIFTFNAIKPGETEILFNYKRPWDNCIGKLKLYKINIAE